jgi:hypothetical protein
MRAYFRKNAYLLATTLFIGCGAEEPTGMGSASFTTWGEDYIEKEIPASEFADGWTVKFTKFLVVIGGVRVADSTGAVGGQMETTKLIDHHAPGVKPVITFENLTAKPWTDVSYSIRPANMTTALGEGATAADLTMMTDQGYAVYVEGSAEKGAEKKTFRWGFTVPTVYAQCVGDKDGREIKGVLVTNGGTDDVELTIHGDHFFYDDLQSPDAALRFDAIASSDADGNGEVTLAELTQKKLIDIDPSSGGYGTGILANVNDLGAFVTALSRTLGHFRGEGECITTDMGSN